MNAKSLGKKFETENGHRTTVTTIFSSFIHDLLLKLVAQFVGIRALNANGAVCLNFDAGH